MNQEDIENALADTLQEEINKEILLDLRCRELVSQGWTLVTLGDNAISNNMGLWMQEIYTEIGEHFIMVVGHLRIMKMLCYLQ